MVKKAEARVLGDPFDPKTNHGAQIDAAQLNKIIGLVDSGVKQGASLQCGGGQYGDKGFYMQPTVFADVKDDMDISTQEVGFHWKQDGDSMIQKVFEREVIGIWPESKNLGEERGR